MKLGRRQGGLNDLLDSCSAASLMFAYETCFTESTLMLGTR